MFRIRILILLGLSFLAASAAWADDVGYIDCSAHSEGTQVFGKPRKSPDVVATVPCGERFTILVYGFVFSQIQTSNGTVGYVYSNIIALDRLATSVQRTGSIQMASVKTKIPSTPAPAPVAKPNPPAQPQPAPAQVAATQPASSQPSTPATSVASTSAPVASASDSSTAEITLTSAPAAPAQPQPASAPASSTQTVSAKPLAPSQSAAAPVSAPTSPTPASNPPEPAATVAQPAQPAAAQPDPAPAAAPEPAPAPIRPASSPTSWEKPLPSVRTTPLMEFFGGYSFARLPGSGPGNNLNGALGSFGWSFRPWLQLTADTSYNYVNVTGGKDVIYGNHYGPRFFRRGHNRWGITPFGEALIGGSREDTTITGVGGYTTSSNCISYKVGGGLDIHPSRHWDIRVFDADYYRTAFGTGLHQNNYWVSTGVVFRLFGGRE